MLIEVVRHDSILATFAYNATFLVSPMVQKILSAIRIIRTAVDLA
jgi:hypothetical protein